VQCARGGKKEVVGIGVLELLDVVGLPAPAATAVVAAGTAAVGVALLKHDVADDRLSSTGREGRSDIERRHGTATGERAVGGRSSEGDVGNE
jgi:hypothetical protein